MRILLIDDDEDLMRILANKLIEQRYAVDIANTGEMGWEFILLFNFDLVVLDWMLPDVEGVTLCQKIRSRGYTMPIMLLTARDRNTDKIIGLDAGADDYTVKPFDFDVLTARIRALLRREINVTAPILVWHDLHLDPKVHEVRYRETMLPLTPKEYALMELLMRHPQQVFSPQAIIDNLWAGEDAPGEEAVRTHIKGLRHKLKAVGMAKDTIKTVYGVGYRLKPDGEIKPNRDEKILLSSRRDKSETITQLWSKFRDLAWQRLGDLDNFVRELEKEKINSKIQEEALYSAHKLAGSLGCFGFPEGSKLAKEIEILLRDPHIAPTSREEMASLISSLRRELQHKPFEQTVKEALAKNISLLIIAGEQDTALCQELVTEASKRGIKTHIAFNLELAQSILDSDSVDAILHKIVFPDGKDLAFLAKLHENKPQLPIIAIAESPQLLDRLQFVRQGGNLILQHPVTAEVAISAISESIENLGAAAKVLIVDDDPQVLLSLEISLQPWGFDLTTLDRSTQFWEVLEAVEPDILILDVDMPDINGLELCQILRSDRQWQNLPVLFLSVHQDEKIQYRAFAEGADDYICKPVSSSVLANRILNRLRRSKSDRR